MKIALLKLSGKTLNDLLTTEKWTDSIKHIRSNFDGLIIVHGAGKDISEWSNKLGLKNEFVNGHRVTTKEQMDVVAAVQAGMLNAKVVARLNATGFESAGFSGIDRNTFSAEYLDKSLGYVGKPNLTGSTAWISELLEKKVIPVFSSVCADSLGNLMNVNADLFSETLALALNADTVFFASDVNGVIINGEIKHSLTEVEILKGIETGQITEGMIPKLTSCIGLLKKGIHKIWIGSKIENDLSLINSNKNGTWIITKYENEYELLKTA